MRDQMALKTALASLLLAACVGFFPGQSSLAQQGPTVTSLALNLSSSNSSDAGVPSSVTIPAGSTSRTFTISTDRVDSNTTVTISATRNGVTKTANVTITSGR